MLTIYIVGAIFVLIGLSVFFGAPYVPSHRKDVRRLFEDYAPLFSEDVVLDLGSGDGIVLREASRRGARAIGYEIHPLFFGISKVLSARDKNIRVKLTNAWLEPFPDDVTLVYAFGVARDGARLSRKVQKEANRLNRKVVIACYGSPLPGKEATQLAGAYYLYSFDPLHSDEA